MEAQGSSGRCRHYSSRGLEGGATLNPPRHSRPVPKVRRLDDGDDDVVTLKHIF